LVGSCGGASSECNLWLNLLGGIVRVVFKLRTRWAQNVGLNSQGLFIPEHGGEWTSAKVQKTREGQQ
jgi:hypothetical protein